MTLTPTRRRTLLIAGLTAAALVVVAAAAALLGLLTDHGPVLSVAVSTPSSSPTPKPSSTPRTYTVFGSVTLGSTYTGNPDCAGKTPSGYFDIKAGAPVFVLDAAGNELARGKLDAGRVDSTGCVFQFLVAGVPAGAGTYELAVTGHRGPALTENDIGRGGAVNLTLA